MAALSKKNSTVIVGGVLFTTVLLNYFSATYLDYPFLWCAGYALTRPLIDPWYGYAWIACIGMIAFGAVTGRKNWWVNGGIFLILLHLLPIFADTLFRLGKSCE